MAKQLTKLESGYCLSLAKKIKSVEQRGGCSICGERDFRVIHFHHQDKQEKKYESKYARSLNSEDYQEELKKCICLCANCHMEFHESENKDISSDKRRKKAKSIILEIAQRDSCEVCGYKKSLKGLTFHHQDPLKKKIDFGEYVDNIKPQSIENVENRIIKEINQCKILCQNCHLKEHFNNDRYKKYKKEIEYKIKNPKIVKRKLNPQDVVRLFKEGNRVIDIARKFNRNKSTISTILKRFNSEVV